MPSDPTEALAATEHPTTIRVEAFREEQFQGVVERIFPEPRNERNVTTYRVDVIIVSENRDKLLVGMRADVSFTAEHVSNVLLCPNDAVRKGPTGVLGVYVPQESEVPGEPADPKFVECMIGLDNGAFFEIREGLSEGDTVYTKLPAKVEDDRERSRSRRN